MMRAYAAARVFKLVAHLGNLLAFKELIEHLWLEQNSSSDTRMTDFSFVLEPKYVAL